MAEVVAVVVPRENVNDESMTLIGWSVADGTWVESGRTVASLETGKAVLDLPAPATGTLRHSAEAGRDVPVGAVIGTIVLGTPEGAGSPPPPLPTVGPPGQSAPEIMARPGPSARRIILENGIDPAGIRGTGRGGRVTKGDLLAHLEEVKSSPDRPPSSTRISPKALALIRQLDLDPRDFEGRGLVRSSDIPFPVGAISPGGVEAPGTPEPHPDPSPSAAPSLPRSAVPTRTEALGRAKRAEGANLRAGGEATVASVVTVFCPTRGLRQALGGAATAVILFEAARLLRKYPAFNAYHQNGEVHYYEHVNVGFAVDAGRGLKVPVVRDADRKGVAEITQEMRDLIVAYLEDSLSADALSKGTFTISDLSGEGATGFHPLISRGQAAILGVCAETLPPGGGSGGFNLVLAFDHQLSEGRAAARFLGELRERLASHESSLSRSEPPAVRGEEPQCARCCRGHAELAAARHVLVKAVRADGGEWLLCTICLNGY